MSRLRLYQITVVAGFILLLEALCLAGFIDKITMPPPHIILRDLFRMLIAGRYFGEIGKSIVNVLVAFASAYLVGVIVGTILHGHKTTRAILDPLFATYYAIPVFAFYPLFIVMFGLGDGPQVLIGFMLAVVAVIITTLNGLDRVPHVLTKVARVHRMGTVATALKLKLPAAAPYLFTGIKLSVSYAFVSVIAAEFILSPAGLGREIADAYNDFNNRRMYALMLLLLAIATVVNSALHAWDIRWARRRGIAST